jgi:hypothetical protein
MVRWRLLAFAAICSLQVTAGPIVYTFATTATGTLGATPFTNAPLVVTLAGDTSGVTAGPSPYAAFLINPGPATLIIGGLGAATLTDPMVAVSTYNSNLSGMDAVFIVDNAPGNGTGLVGTAGSAFYGYNLASSLGPIVSLGGVWNGGGPTNTFPTTAGTLEFASVQPPVFVPSTFTAVTTQNLTGYQGGTTTAPVFLVAGAPIGEVSGTISGQGAQDYYWFYWGGGVFAATASVTGASSGASYLFTYGVAGSSCSGGGSQTLNSGDSFTSTFASANLAPGQYCIGIDANSANDPNFSLTFDTPVNGVPEPSGFVLLSAGLGMIVLRRARRSPARFLNLKQDIRLTRR